MPLGRFFEDKMSRGTAVTFGFTVFNFFISLFASIIVTRYLGPSGVGILAMGFMVLEFVAIVENLPYLGFVRDWSISEKPNKLSTLLGIKLAINVASTVALFATAIPLANALHVPPLLLQSFALIPVFSIVDTCTSMVYEARRKMAVRSIPGTVENVVKLTLYAAFVYVLLGAVAAPEHRLEIIIACTVAASVSSTLVALLFIPSLRLRHFSRKKARYYLKFGAKTQPVQLISKVIFWFAIVLISFVINFTQMGLYKVAYSTMFYVITFTSVVSFALYPTLSEAHGKGSKKEVERSFSLGFFYAVGIAAPAVIVIFLFPDFIITTLYGAAFADSAWMIRWLAPVALIYAFIHPCEALFPAVNRPALLLRLAFVEVIVNVSLNVVLLPRIGIIGAIIAAWATFIAGAIYAYYEYFRLGYGRPRFMYLREVLSDN